MKKFNDADWSIEDAIRERVRQEDLVNWARKKTVPVKEVRKVTVQQEKLGHAFPLQIIKYLQP